MYSVDAMPNYINARLRENRRDTTLPDTHGQIWMELHHRALADNTLFTGTTSYVQTQVLKGFGLGGSPRFPVRRLATLWKNNNWRDMITRWCWTTVGRE